MKVLGSQLHMGGDFGVMEFVTSSPYTNQSQRSWRKVGNQATNVPHLTFIECMPH